MICGACSGVAKPEHFSGGIRYRCVKCGKFSISGLEKKRRTPEEVFEKVFGLFDKTIDRIAGFMTWFPIRFRKSLLRFHSASWKIEDAFIRLEKTEERIHEKNQKRMML
jgi:hypothetical protein